MRLISLLGIPRRVEAGIVCLWACFADRRFQVIAPQVKLQPYAPKECRYRMVTLSPGSEWAAIRRVCCVERCLSSRMHQLTPDCQIGTMAPEIPSAVWNHQCRTVLEGSWARIRGRNSTVERC